MSKANIGILIGEPSGTVTKIVTKILNDNGYTKLFYGTNIAECMAVLEKRETDIALFDFKMATARNMELIDIIAVHKHLFRLPMLLMGSHAPIGLIDEAMRLGARDYLNMPFTPYLLMVRLEKILFGPQPKKVVKPKLGEPIPAEVAAQAEVQPKSPGVLKQEALAKRLFHDGMEALELRKYDKAIKKLATAARVNTLFPEAYEAIAEAFRGQGNLELSGQFLSKAAETFAWLGRNHDAAKTFERTRKLDENAPNPFKTIGDHLEDQGRPGELVKAYEKAAALAPHDSNVRVALSRAYVSAGDEKKAAQTMRPLIAKGEVPKDMENLIVHIPDTRTRGSRRLQVLDESGAYDGEEKRHARRISLAEYSARLPKRDESFQVVDASLGGISFKHGGETFEVGQKVVVDLMTLEGVKVKKMQAVIKRVSPMMVGCELMPLSGSKKKQFGKIVRADEEE